MLTSRCLGVQERRKKAPNARSLAHQLALPPFGSFASFCGHPAPDAGLGLLPCRTVASGSAKEFADRGGVTHQVDRASLRSVINLAGVDPELMVDGRSEVLRGEGAV